MINSKTEISEAEYRLIIAKRYPEREPVIRFPVFNNNGQITSSVFEIQIDELAVLCNDQITNFRGLLCAIFFGSSTRTKVIKKESSFCFFKKVIKEIRQDEERKPNDLDVMLIFEDDCCLSKVDIKAPIKMCTTFQRGYGHWEDRRIVQNGLDIHSCMKSEFLERLRKEDSVALSVVRDGIPFLGKPPFETSRTLKNVFEV